MSASPAEKSLRRVLFISAMDGWSIALFAGLCTLISLCFFQWIGVLVGGLITIFGVIELRGRHHLTTGRLTGLQWLIGAQIGILATVVIYAFINILTYDEAAIMARITPDLRRAVETLIGLSIEDFRSYLKPAYRCIYLTVIGVTILFQGGLALYYHTSRAKVAAALAARRTPPAVPDHPVN